MTSIKLCSYANSTEKIKKKKNTEDETMFDRKRAVVKCYVGYLIKVGRYSSSGKIVVKKKNPILTSLK